MLRNQSEIDRQRSLIASGTRLALMRFMGCLTQDFALIHGAMRPVKIAQLRAVLRRDVEAGARLESMIRGFRFRKRIHQG